MRALIALAFAGVLLAGVGCKPAPVAADPAKARETLRSALDAWKKGETLVAFRQRSPSITVVEAKWQSGYRLLAYELSDGDEMEGYDCRCRVKLSLQSATGKKSQENALFVVSTSPALVIVRGEQ